MRMCCWMLNRWCSEHLQTVGGSVRSDGWDVGVWQAQPTAAALFIYLPPPQPQRAHDYETPASLALLLVPADTANPNESTTGRPPRSGFSFFISINQTNKQTNRNDAPRSIDRSFKFFLQESNSISKTKRNLKRLRWIMDGAKLFSEPSSEIN